MSLTIAVKAAIRVTSGTAISKKWDCPSGR
jgi:hypothetical protein